MDFETVNQTAAEHDETAILPLNSGAVSKWQCLQRFALGFLKTLACLRRLVHAGSWSHITEYQCHGSSTALRCVCLEPEIEKNYSKV